MKQRIAMDHHDHIARIKELETQVNLRDLELLQLRGAHPDVQLGSCMRESDYSCAGSTTIGH